MKIIIPTVIVLIGIIIFALNYSSKPTDVNVAEVSSDNSANVINATVNEGGENEIKKFEITDFNFSFIGYGPAGKFHEGKIDSEIVDPTNITFDMTTVKTDDEGLDKHLCEDDFFNCAEYPNSYFILEDIYSVDGEVSKVVGIYQMKGVSKQITFEAKPAEGSSILGTGNGQADYIGEFLLNTEEFDFKVPIVEPEVLIKFEFSVNQTIEVTEETEENENATSTEEVISEENQETE
jgi:polyisoprenoid-binding protein YceI